MSLATFSVITHLQESESSIIKFELRFIVDFRPRLLSQLVKLNYFKLRAFNSRIGKLKQSLKLSKDFVIKNWKKGQICAILIP